MAVGAQGELGAGEGRDEKKESGSMGRMTMGMVGRVATVTAATGYAISRNFIACELAVPKNGVGLDSSRPHSRCLCW